MWNSCEKSKCTNKNSVHFTHYFSDAVKWTIQPNQNDSLFISLISPIFHFTITSLTIHNAINQPNIISYISLDGFVQTSNEIHKCVTGHFVDLYFFVALPTVKTFKTVNLYKMPCYFCFQTIKKLLWLGISNGRSLKTSMQTNIAIKSQKLPSQKNKITKWSCS